MSADRDTDSGSFEGEADASLGSKVWEQVSTLLFAVLIALGIRAFAIEPFRIPSGSMLPTLLIGDHLFINKFVYGIKVPFTDYRLPGFRDPERGDVVVFSVAQTQDRMAQYVPADRRPDLPRTDFVKRIVGIPGDRVEVREGGRVHVNGKLVQAPVTGDVHVDDYGRRLTVRSEQLEGCAHAVLDDPNLSGHVKTEFTVQPGRYFMMGDNRDYSNDSRGWGTVRKTELKGPAFILYWSWDVNGNALEFLKPTNWWSAEKRWDRIFKPVRCEPTQSV
jgi:signal peptidase I